MQKMQQGFFVHARQERILSAYLTKSIRIDIMPQDPSTDTGIEVTYVDRQKEFYNTAQYNCQGGFIMIIEPDNPMVGKMKTTCIPSALVAKVTIKQNI